MPPAKNKAIVRRSIEELFNAGEFPVADELFAPDFVNHDPVHPGLPRGPEGARQIARLYRGAFPDLRLTIEDQVAEGDRVVTRWTARGTHRGELMGISPTGKQAMVTGITVNRVSGGRIAETWVNWDTAGLLQQLGAIAPLVPAGG